MQYGLSVISADVSFCLFITSCNGLSVISADVSFCLFITSCNGLSVISADVCFVCSLLHVMASWFLIGANVSVLSVHYFMQWPLSY